MPLTLCDELGGVWCSPHAASALGITPEAVPQLTEVVSSIAGSRLRATDVVTLVESGTQGISCQEDGVFGIHVPVSPPVFSLTFLPFAIPSTALPSTTNRFKVCIQFHGQGLFYEVGVDLLRPGTCPPPIPLVS